MSRYRDGRKAAPPVLLVTLVTALLTTVALLPAMAQADKYPRIGRAATPAEIAAWDIDVRADFKGLPPGSGTVAAGEKIWIAKCVSCHGEFGESPAVFPPLVGGTTKADIERGRVAGLTAATENAKTTMMKLATVSTLWDYIYRAMPFDAPKSLRPDEVYAVTAFLLNLADVVPADFTLSDRSMADAQARMPNRLGNTMQHGMLDVKGKPDVSGDGCMSNCPVNPASLTVLPPSVNGLNGNLAEQNRSYGSIRGIDTRRSK
ncbi:MAG: cytochrome c [Burkholderiaceae bacterium]|nr:cytochrome c [Burkholderiaceae bacterium]